MNKYVIMEINSKLCISPASHELAVGDSLFDFTVCQLEHDVTDSIMDLDPIVNLFTYNHSPTCNRSDLSLYDNSIRSQIKPDKSSLASESSSPSTFSSPKHALHNNSTNQNYNVTSLSSGQYQNNTQYFNSPPSPNCNQTNFYHNSNIDHHSINNNHSNNVPYNAYHPQIQMNSNNYSCHNLSQNLPEYTSHSPPMHFPTASMSVNLSMNMTMGFSGNDPQQVQWGTPISNSAYQTNYSSQVPPTSISYLNHMHSSAYPSPSPTSYTITAEFRPSSDHLTTLPPIEKEFAGVCNIKPSHSSLYSYHKNMTDSYHHFCQNNNNNTNKSMNKNGSVNISENCESSAKNIANNTMPNLCRICGKTYARPSTLKTHLRTHSGERPYRCSTCSKSFSQAANLTAHIRTHSGEKPFRCPVCDRRFSQSSSVTTHMRTHSGERPYRCNMCKKAFSDSSTLTKHLRIHSGEKPYQCKLCMLRFSQSGNLNRHMRIHTNVN